MLRRLSTLLSTVSLLLCVATGVLWARSYWRADYIERGRAVPGDWPERGDGYTEELHLLGVYSACGQVEVRLERWLLTSADDADRVGTVWVTEGAPTPLPPPRMGRFTLGFFYRSSAQYVGYGYERRTVLVVPYWSAAVPAAVLPAVCGSMLLMRRRQARRVARGRCPGCGYDLRATPDRCPECGAVPLRGTPA